MIYQFINRCPKHWRWPLARLYYYVFVSIRQQRPSMLLAAAAIVPGTMMISAWIVSLLAPLLPWLCALISASYVLMAAIAWLTQR